MPAVVYLQTAWFVLMVTTVAAAAPSYNDTEFVFETWINNTGWNNNAICFITGLINPLYSLGGLDSITVCLIDGISGDDTDKATAHHGGDAKRKSVSWLMEVPYIDPASQEETRPWLSVGVSRIYTGVVFLTSPTACALGIAFVTGLSYMISLMFSVQNYSALGDTNTNLPLAEIFRQATQSRGGAFGMIFMLWIALGPCMLGSQLSRSSLGRYPASSDCYLGTGRVFWAFARDDGLPFSRM